jgi:START domain-containing protein
MRRLVPILLSGLLAAAALAQSDGWQRVEEVQGDGAHTLYRRQLPDSRVAAFRLEGQVDAPIARVLDAQRAGEKPRRADDGGPRRQLLRRDGDTTITYTYMPVPLLADRDLVLRQEHSVDPATGTHRFVWHTIEGEGPPPPKGVVRIQRSEGMWEFTPQGDSHTRLVLESLTDAGGSLPAWVVNSFYPRELRREWNGLLARIRNPAP